MTEIKSSNMASRPHFFDDPVSDELAAIVLALTGELAVVFDRLDTVERLLSKSGVLDLAEVDAFRPDADLAATRKAKHTEYLRRVFRILRMQSEPGSHFAKFDEMTEYKELMKKATAD